MGIELVPPARTRALALMRERDGMEAEMEAIGSALTVGLSTSSIHPPRKPLLTVGGSQLTQRSRSYLANFLTFPLRLHRP
jgi:hypothetical protein